MKTEVLKNVDANKEKMIQLVSDLVKIPSVSGNEAELAKFLMDYCTKLGFECEIDRHGNFFAFIKGKRPGKRLGNNSMGKFANRQKFFRRDIRRTSQDSMFPR